MGLRPAPDVVVGGKYRLVRRIARGGMGSVWHAKHQALDADVAIKLMSPSLTETPTAFARFEREAKASAQLRSPHILRVQDYGVEDETPFMVLELLEGEDLGQRLDRQGRLPIDEVARINAQVCKALGVAHEAGIVHRDLKPSNIFLAKEGGDEVVKLFDFGIARETKSQLVDERTSSGVVLGSPHHMSPEQAHGQPVDHRSDLWSLGVVLFRALTGVRPFDGENMTAVMLAVVTKPVPLASELCPDLPPALDRFFALALSREIDRRFASAATMAEALGAIAKGETADKWLVVGSPPRARSGRDEATLDAARPVGEEKIVSDATASRELRAVTAGLDPSIRPRRSRVWRVAPLALLVVAIGSVGFLAGRSRIDDGGDRVVGATADPPAPVVQTAAPTSAPIATDTVPTDTVPADTPPVAAGSTAAGPSVTPADAVAPNPAKPPTLVKPPPYVPPPKGPPPKGPKAPPKIDPFTGLPIAP